MTGVDYKVAVNHKTITLQPRACECMAQAADRLPRLWQAQARREELLRQALIARHFFHRDQSHAVQDGKVVLLDEFTGRMTPTATHPTRSPPRHIRNGATEMGSCGGRDRRSVSRF